MKKIPLQKEQYFSDVMPLIPSNSLINKKVTGCGATYAEIKSARSSIILEPNVPVIKTKCDKLAHIEDNLFGVYEGITIKAIEKYLIESMYTHKYIKLLTTPESFWKIKKAFQQLELDMYKSCFLLFDECHKIIKDVDYRKNVTLPFEDFFRFENKALISATPIYMSDPRFEKFEYIEFEPQFIPTKSLIFYPTNNILESLKRIIIESEEDTLCIFFNSTDYIHALIQQLGIEKHSTVFCAPKSVERLRCNGFEAAYSDFNSASMKRFNFFTSRFFCALDIELDIIPYLITISDVRRVRHTALDPFTDIRQIIGRFRNGVHKYYHITTLDENLPVNTPEDLRQQINEMEVIYEYLKMQYNSATDRNMRIALNDCLERLPYKAFLSCHSDKPYEDKKDWFRIDNYIDENLTLSYYQSYDNLKKAFESAEQCFSMEVINGFYRLDECKKLFVPSKTKIIKQKRKEIVEQLEFIGEWSGSQFKQEWRNSLYRADSFIVEAYELLGKQVIEELKYSKQKINAAMILKKYEDKEYVMAFTDLIKNSFLPNMKYRIKEVKEKVMEIYQKLKLYPLRTITAQTIIEYFDVKETWIGRRDKRTRAYYIVRAKY